MDGWKRVRATRKASEKEENLCNLVDVSPVSTLSISPALSCPRVRPRLQERSLLLLSLSLSFVFVCVTPGSTCYLSDSFLNEIPL